MEANRLQAVVIAEPAQPETLNMLKEELDKLTTELLALAEDRRRAESVAVQPQLRLQKEP